MRSLVVQFVLFLQTSNIMKHILLSALAVGSAILGIANDEGTTRYKVNATESIITWNASKVTGEHSGTVNVANGYISMTDNKMVSANVIADMTTIACTDLEGEWGDKLVGHLVSEDFFHVDEYATSSFTLRDITPLSTTDGAATHNVVGDFTIRGITQSVSFPATIVEQGGELMINGAAVLDRTDYDIVYRSGSMFDTLGDKMIYDEFTIGFNLVAEAQ